MKILFNLDTTAIIIIVIASAIAALLVAIIPFFVRRRRPKPGRIVPEIATSDLTNAIVSSVGGIENITSCSNKLTRLLLEIKDSSLYQEDAIKAIGLNYILMEKKVTFVIGSSSVDVAAEINQLLK